MDVTSLLNSGTEAAVQHERIETSHTPLRSRTPWDAGGYSLPMNTISIPPHSADSSVASPQATPLASSSIHCIDTQFDIQKRNENSPRHKSFSSRSSLSSSTSSLHSGTHSRLSSLSTVNSCHPGQSGYSVIGLPFAAEHTSHHLDFISPDGPSDHNAAQSPASSLGALALVAEQHLSAERADFIDENPTTLQATPSLSTTNPPTLFEGRLLEERPRSPSDAILIKRRLAPLPQTRAEETDLNKDHQQLNSNYLSALSQAQPHFIRSHKRCVSAPDISSIMDDFPIRQPATMRPGAEPTPPSSQPPGSTSPTTSTYPAPDTPPSVTADPEVDAVVCMYIENCDTGSQPRKAISHIFGRNKMCTRLIPSHVWVHYCRKHYQRSRYRNPKEYAKLQCDLVQQQIRRVHEWSIENTKKGAASVVQDWGLSVRKREKKRLDDLGGANRKRRAGMLDDEEAESFDVTAGATGSPVPATAVPDWLLSLCGKGYSTQEILEIFNRLHTEILADRMTCFPDIEILPNIAVDQDEPSSPKSGHVRRRARTAHRRSQSLGVTMKSESNSPDRRSSAPSTGGSDIQSDAWAGQKRRRPDEQDLDELERFLPKISRSRMGETPPDTGRRIQHLVHRPVFANITENQAGEDQDNYPRSSASYQPPNSATNNQRSGRYPMGAIEEHSYHPFGSRRFHGRSRSDVTAFTHGHAPSQPAMPSGYFMDDLARPTQQQGQGHPTSYTFLPPQNSVPSVGMRQLPNPGHARHQSTPAAYQPSNEPPSQSTGPQSNTSHARNNNGVRHQPRQVYETQVTKDLYSSRR